MSLDLLIQKCKKNDTNAQSEIYKLFSGKLFAVCLKYSRSHVDAEDNLQDAFVTIFEKMSQYNYKGSFEGWLKRIVVNTVLQKYRRKGVFNIVSEVDIEDKIIEVEDYHVDINFLLHSIQELPDRYRLVFNLYALDGYSHKEIAKMLDISTGTTKSNLARARVILKNKIENYNANFNLQSL